MRLPLMSLAGLALACGPTLAQQPPVRPQAPQVPPLGAPQVGQPVAPAPAPASTLDPKNNRLDALLIRWEQEMKGVQSMAAQAVRTTVDKTFQTTEVYEGTAKYMKPNLAMLEMVKKGKPEVFEKYICSGTFLYEFVPANKIVRAHELPQNKQGQLADDNFLSFLFGMKAEEAKRRYDLKLVKEDEWWIYMEVVPKFPADKADFAKARLTLNAKTFLPRQFWMEQPNGNEVTWDLPKSEAGAKLNRNDFGAPQVPQGWNLVKVPRGQEATAPNPKQPGGKEMPPRIVRPNER